MVMGSKNERNERHTRAKSHNSSRHKALQSLIDSEKMVKRADKSGYFMKK
jgi:hypothetical protein